MHGMDLDADLSDSESDDSNTGYTEVRVDGQTHIISAENGVSVVNIPGLRNLQIGSGQVKVIGTGRSRHAHRTHSPKGNQHRAFTGTSKLTDSTSKPSRQDLNHVCNNIGKHWKQLGGQFGLTRGQIEAIEVDHHIEGNYEMAYQTLLKWKRQNGDQVTIRDLAHALYSIGLTELALELPVS